MSIPENQAANSQLPSDIPSLHQIIHNLAAKLMAHSQTVSELLRANMDMHAALHLVKADKAKLEEYVKNLTASPAPAEAAPAVEAPVEAAPAEAAPAVEAPVDADPVSA